MNNLILPEIEPLKMSSGEIAELTGKEKKTVHRDIKAMCAQLYDDGTDLHHASNFGVVLKLDSRGYCEFIFLDRKHADCLLTGYSARARMKVIERWHELESKPTHKIPQTLSEALRLAADLSQEKEQALIEVNRLQKTCHTIANQFADGVTPPRFCKQLNGVNTQKINGFLISLGALTSSKSGLMPTSCTRGKYLTDHQIKTPGGMRSEPRLTKRGAKWLYQKYLKNKLPMLVNWDGEFTRDVLKSEVAK